MAEVSAEAAWAAVVALSEGVVADGGELPSDVEAGVAGDPWVLPPAAPSRLEHCGRLDWICFAGGLGHEDRRARVADERVGLALSGCISREAVQDGYFTAAELEAAGWCSMAGTDDWRRGELAVVMSQNAELAASSGRLRERARVIWSMLVSLLEPREVLRFADAFMDAERGDMRALVVAVREILRERRRVAAGV